MKKKKEIFKASLFFAAVFLFAACGSKPSESAYPNVIFILADDLGYGDLSCFNEDGKIQTVNLDRLAGEGMKFTDAHSFSGVCSPTRYSIITGRYSFRSPMKKGVLSGMSESLIPAERTTVASLLKKQGYHTAFIGKWHLGWDWQMVDGSSKRNMANIAYDKIVEHNPNELGFDYAYGHCGSLDMPPYVYVENGRVTSAPDRVEVDSGYAFFRKGPTGADFIHEEVTPNFFDHAKAYIRERAREKNPFFLYLALPSPHTPILPTREWIGSSGLNPYGDFVLMIDHYMGEFMKTLEEEGIADNTLLIFTSDNGCSPKANFKVLGKKGHDPSYIYRGYKADLYEGGHRVPFIVRWPGVIKAGSKNEAVVCSVDFMATMAELTGYELSDDEAEDSFSLLPLFKGDNDAFKRENLLHHSIAGQFAIREGDWKLILNGGSGGWSWPRINNYAALDTLPKIQLYNLATDPSEQMNVYDVYPEKVEELQNKFIKIYNDGRSTPGEKQENDVPMNKWDMPDFLKGKLEGAN